MDNFKIDNVHVALKLLKEGEILVSKNNSLTFFALKKDKIHCQNASSSYNLKFDEFLNLFLGSIFYIYKYDSTSSIDLKKDEEYYNWDILKK